MRIIKSIDEMQQEAIAIKKIKTIGFVPTMGYLHIGHQKLIETARKQCDVVIVSIFVNPLQFGVNEDLDKYPQDLNNDINRCSESGADIIFTPNKDELTANMLAYISITNLDKHLCGSKRQGHFKGVCTIVAKLFNIVQPSKAYFGNKDIQQLKIIEQMTLDLNFPVEIIPIETVRDTDGLAYSSRNSYLNSIERQQATIVPKVLEFIEQEIVKGKDKTEILNSAQDMVSQNNLAKIDYIEIVDSKLQPTNLFDQDLIIATAIFIGKTRLIDNKIIISK